MKRSILVIEDEMDIRDTLKLILEDAGFEVHSASNGSDAFDVLKQISTPQLILLDVLMPVMNGCEFRRAQLDSNEFNKIPVLVMSADNHARRKIAETGLTFLKKPIDLTELLEKVEKLADRAS
jgi:CheY-like chemotaxis protein